MEGKEEQPFQKLSVVASSGPGQQAAQAFQKHEEKSSPLVRAECGCACGFLGGGTVSLSASSSDSSLASTVLPTEAQYGRFQLRDFCRDSRVGLALSYSLGVHVHHPHLFEFRYLSCSDLPRAPRVETQ